MTGGKKRWHVNIQKTCGGRERGHEKVKDGRRTDKKKTGKHETFKQKWSHNIILPFYNIFISVSVSELLFACPFLKYFIP